MMISNRHLRFGHRLMLIASIACGTLSVQNSGADEGTIDRHLAAVHDQTGVVRTDLCDDATFLRRLSLDLMGRVPTEIELVEFLRNPDRTASVDRLLDSPEHPRFWSQLWTSMLIGRAEQRGVERELLQTWVEKALSEELPISQMAFQLITAQGVSSLDGPVNFVVASRQDPVMRLSRIFLSVRLDCAQCHDHPNDRWTNDDYLSMQRFYRSTRYREVSGGIAVSDAGGASESKLPVFLTGRKPHTAAWRQELGWMVVQSKPFSRAMVNRVWHWLMGRGIIEPVDGLSRDNPPVVPGLLDALATDFRSDFRLRGMIRRICLSDAYQRTPLSGRDAAAEKSRSLFASRTIRPLLPEQWALSVAVVLDRPIPSPADLAERSRKLLGIVRQASPSSDPFDWSATSQTMVRQLSLEIPAPLRDLDSIFLATLARKPTQDERSMMARHRSRDMLFALVHSNEFMMND